MTSRYVYSFKSSYFLRHLNSLCIIIVLIFFYVFLWQAAVAIDNHQNAGESNRSRSSSGFIYFGAGVAGLLGLAGVAYADEAEHGLHAANYPWSHEGVLSSYDHAAYVNFYTFSKVLRAILPLLDECTWFLTIYCYNEH